MKKLLPVALLLLFTTLFSFNSDAQESRFGLRAGFNISNLSGDDAEGFDSRTGMYLGVVYDYVYSDRFGADVGIGFSQMGAEGSNDSTSLYIDYLTWHALAKYRITSGLNVNAGFQLGAYISAESAAGEDFTENIKPFDFGLKFGAGYDFDFGLGFSVHYYYGLSTIGEEVEVFTIGINSTTEQLDISNSALQLSVHYLFR